MLKNILIGFLFILALLGTIVGIYLTSNPAYFKWIEETPTANSYFKETVYVSGAINTPGVYEIQEGMRIIDIIEIAGGFSSEADSTFIAEEINLSEYALDQQHIFIPFQQIEIDYAPETNTNLSNQININTATATELETLPGVGPSTAEKIIGGRPYSSVDDLLQVSGIGDKTLSQFKNLITTGQ